MKKTILLISLLFVMIVNVYPTNARLNYEQMNKEMEQSVGYKKWKSNKVTDYKKLKPGTILVTPDKFKGLIPTGHAAMIVNKDKVIEATSKGVIYGNNDWINRKSKVNTNPKRYTIAVRVNRLSDSHHLKAVNYSKRHWKKKYNYNFLNTKTRNSFYCSHLIWSVFYDLFKINLDTTRYGLAGKNPAGAIHPMELVASNQTKRVFYYENKAN